MTDKKPNPAQRAAGRAQEVFLLGGWNNPENSKSPVDIQRLRAAWVARRFAVAPDLAIFIASLALGEATR